MAEMGRPPKITVKWADDQAKTLPDLFKDGESLAEVCVELNICKDSFYKACQISADFSDAYKKGQEKSEAWWQKLGRAGAAGKHSIQPATWVFNMKNRFGWVDKKEVSGPGGGPIKKDTTYKVEVVDAKPTDS